MSEIKVRLNDLQMRLVGVYAFGLSYILEGLRGLAILFTFVLAYVLGEALLLWFELRKGAERDE